MHKKKKIDIGFSQAPNPETDSFIRRRKMQSRVIKKMLAEIDPPSIWNQEINAENGKTVSKKDGEDNKVISPIN